MVQFLQFLALFLCASELFNTLTHLTVLSGRRLLPLKDLRKLRFYFLVETLSVVASAILSGKLYLVASLHVAQHLYGSILWESTRQGKRIISWSCLEWFESKNGQEKCRDFTRGRLHPIDCFLHTVFDLSVHFVLFYVLATEYLDTARVLVVLCVTTAAVCMVFFNRKYAWSCPGNVPAWVRRRLGTLTMQCD
ncbi:hypothetical protein ElyMa_005235100 [Elysia marginata]|uniref:XK-related protein n=1 Tax=Elysia marginata TaxID=1093978 RepID=A0AAV4JXQ1_9GAST|nr:hypothetical protein ElyMa_005235100 [Elysia marginata]